MERARTSGATLRWSDAVAAGAPAGAWRDLGEYLGATPRSDEFPRGAARPPDEVSRRRFLGLLGGALGAAGLGGCADPPAQQALVAYARQPAGVVPGLARHYPTTLERDGFGIGVVGTCREGRPTKLEGDPAHPASLGASGAGEQAALSDLYDPCRLAAPRLRGQPCDWESVLAAALAPCADDGDGLALLVAATASPLVDWAVARLRARRPRVRVFVHDPRAAAGEFAASEALFGQPLIARADVARADVVIALDADPLADGAWSLAHARAFAARRRPEDGTPARWHVAEGTWSPTGTIADRRLPAGDALIAALAAHLATAAASALGVGAAETSAANAARPPLDDASRAWLDRALEECGAKRGAALFIAGPRQPAAVHAAAALANDAFGAAASGAVAYAVSPMPTWDGGLDELLAAHRAGAVRSLVVLGGDPVYASPGDSDLAGLLRALPGSLAVGAYDGATAAACLGVAPLAHPLESWGDARALDGTISLVQPLIRPLTAGRSVAEVVAGLADLRESGRELLLRAWRERLGLAPEADLEHWLATVLQAGHVADSALPAVATRLDAARAVELCAASPPPPPPPALVDGTLELALRPDPRLGVGAQANNPWLIELPAPVTTLTWGNAALLAPADAAALAIVDGDELELRIGDQAPIAIPALVLPGHAAGAVTVHLGWGRDAPALVAAHGIGVDAFPLQRLAARWTRPGVRIRRTGRRVELALTQGQWPVQGEEVARVRATARWAERADAATPATLKPPLTAHRAGPRWAMAIDLTVCTGCAACVVACQAENNIPAVGAEAVRAGRVMHWLRVDRYFRGPAAAPLVVQQPMACQHCERAPCETVCPTGATTHSPDGLNEMTYNRCVGTRFCSNNCPYKVRRFNWFDFHAGELERGDRRALSRNPEVSVRARGVMEKCTYCVQRIRAQQAGHAPGPVVSACQQACPTRAIVFGDADDATSAVAARLASPRAYAALGELGVEPRTRYLARLADATDGSGS